MTLWEAPWLGPVLVANFTLFQILMATNSRLCHVGFITISLGTSEYTPEDPPLILDIKFDF